MNLATRAKKLWKLFTTGGLSGTDKLILALAILYCLSPVDIIPDVIPVAGFLDDLAVVLAALRKIGNKDAPSSGKGDDPDNATPVDVKVL